jgi:hypothetical protein
MRGRIFSFASRWTGSASSFSSMTTTDAVDPGLASTFVTWPTFTPAMRTGDFAWMLVAFSKTARSSYGFCHGYLWTNAM